MSRIYLEIYILLVEVLYSDFFFGTVGCEKFEKVGESFENRFINRIKNRFENRFRGLFENCFKKMLEKFLSKRCWSKITPLKVRFLTAATELSITLNYL